MSGVDFGPFSFRPRRFDYLQIYTDAGNELDEIWTKIPIIACGHFFGNSYARSVSFGLSKVFSLNGYSIDQVENQVHSYLLHVCAERAKDENCEQIFDEVIHSLARGRVSVFALSYKHKMFGGSLGRRQRVSSRTMHEMAAEIVHYALHSGKEYFCFWLDQILGQRMPLAERHWINNGLLPYAVFETIVFPYSEHEQGAWLMAERLLASGSSIAASPEPRSGLIRRIEVGGPASLMKAASAIAGGAVDFFRGKREEVLSIVKWSLDTLDMSQYMNGQQVGHFTRPFFPENYFGTSQWDHRRLRSIMFNLDLYPGEVKRFSTGSSRRRRWEQEAGILSSLIPSSLKICCDGSWLSRESTSVYVTNNPNRFVYLQTVRRNGRSSLVIAAVTIRQENLTSNMVVAYMAASVDQYLDPTAQLVLEKGHSLVNWAPVTEFLQECDVAVKPCEVDRFNGKWQCS